MNKQTKENKYIDLSLLLTKDTPIFPGEPDIIFRKHLNMAENSCNEHQITINSHFGTHIDFPYHMFDNGKKSSDFNMEKFIGKGKIIDTRNLNTDNLNICDEEIFLLYTGHMDNNIDNLFNGFPYANTELIDLLIANKPKMLLFDTPSPDCYPYPIHKKLLQNDILIVENVCNMQKLLGKRFKIYAIPLNFADFDGSPCRVFAEIL